MWLSHFRNNLAEVLATKPDRQMASLAHLFALTAFAVAFMLVMRLEP
jgi:hypothetical protein